MPGITHGQGELRLLRHAHTLEIHGHRESAYLGITDLPPAIPLQSPLCRLRSVPDRLAWLL